MSNRPRPRLVDTPVLETERLILRAPEAGDFDAFAAHVASERARFTGGPQDRATAWRAFGHMTGHWALRGFGLFFFADKASGELLGFAGPWFPEGWPEPEIGWSVISDAAEGKGYAFEAASAARLWARDALDWRTAVSLIDPANTRSQTLAKALGCRPEGPGLVMGKPCIVWRHPALEGLT